MPKACACSAFGFISAGSAKCSFTYAREPSSPCSSAVHRPSRTVRAIFKSSVFKIRIASMATAAPAALSVAPVPPVHESKCPPSITKPAFGLLPGISATRLNESAGSVNFAPMSNSSVTGRFFSSSRAIRL